LEGAKSGLGPFERPLAFVGQWSYSIYLWHVFVLSNIPGVAHRLFGINTLPRMPLPVLAVLYVSGSIVFGCFAHRLVELPAIRIRDRVVPRRSLALPR